MTLMAFPAGPADGDTFGKWVYEAASGSWVLNEGAITLAQSTTDDLAEGTTNLYYTDARVDSDIGDFIVDEDAMTSNDDTRIPTQQSVKTYVDTVTGQLGVNNFLGNAVVTEAEGLSSSDNDTSLPTTAAVIDYVANANSSTATTLQTSRQINGTSFNGSADITTANWGTARNISIGGTTKSINGSTNYTWAKSEIQANNADTLTTARTIGGVSFDGSANINLPGVNTAGNQNTSGSAGSLSAASTITSGEGIGSNNNDTTYPTSAAVKAYVDAATPTLTAGNGISVSGSTISMSGSYTGSFTATGDITAFSDRSLKKSVVQILEPMEKVKGLTGYTFIKDGQLRRTTGLIAQDVQAVLPEAVHEHEDGLLSVAYGNLVGLLVESIKELNARVEELESKQ